MRSILIVLAVLSPVTASAQAGRSNVRDGNRAYAEGRYAEAYEKYLDALRDDPDSPVIHFNEANALYQSAEFQRAMEAYQQAVETGDPALQSQAFYNLGNALYRQQQLEQSLEAYKQAMRLDPSDSDAKHNYELVREQLEQQQQQQPQDGEQNQDDQQGQDDQQDQQNQQQQQDENSAEQDQQNQEDQEQQDNQDQDQDPDQQNQGQDPSDDQQDEQQQQQEQPTPGEMSREEAERLLGAIEEDPGEVNRQRKGAQTVKKSKKDW
jgi:tetratricopeptide (TPR) repeat protein